MEPEHPTTIILSIGHDPELLSTRHLLLQHAGYLVDSTSSIERALKSLHDGDFDLVIMCHTVSLEERARLTYRIREDGSFVPVVILAAGSAPDPDWLASASSGSAPLEFLHNVKVSLQQGRSVREMNRRKESNVAQVALTGWKEIARYIGKGVRTVQRWEREFGFPVRRPAHSSHKAILALPEEIDAWVRATDVSAQHCELDRLRLEVERLKREVDRPRSTFASTPLASTLVRRGKRGSSLTPRRTALSGDFGPTSNNFDGQEIGAPTALTPGQRRII